MKAGDVFVALVGENSDGHSYVTEALNLGASKIIYHDKKVEGIIPLNKRYFVEDTSKWLYTEASKFIGNSKVVCITGSVGKTTTHRLLQTLLKNLPNNYQDSVFSPVSGINTLRGIAFEILNRYNNENIVLLETGIDTYLELDLLAGILNPTFGAITNIDISHIEKIGTIDKIARSKFGLCKSNKLEWLILNKDDKNTTEFVTTKFRTLVETHEFKDCKLCFTSNTGYAKKHKIKIKPDGFTLNLNIAIELFLLITREVINDSKLQCVVDGFTHTNKRFEIIKIEGHTILNDCYNAAPKSFDLFLNYIDTEFKNTKKLGVIGQINEIGHLTDSIHKELIQRCLKTFDMVIFVGDNFIKQDKQHVETNKCLHYFVNTYAYANKLLDKCNLSDYGFIGIKGSRGNMLENCTETIVNALKTRHKDL